MRILRAPLELGRFVWQFLNPSRTAGRVALGRFTILVQVVAVLIFVGYTLHKKSIALPFVSSGKYVVRVWHPDMKDEPAQQIVTVSESDRPELAFTVVAAPKAMTTAPLNKTEEKFKKFP